MPGRKLTPLGVLAKWLVVPVAFGAIGFFVLGPRLTKVAPKLTEKVADVAQSKKSSSYSAPDIDVDSVPASRYNPAPDVEVTAKERRPRRRRHRSHPVEESDNGREPVEAYAAPEPAKPATGPDGV